MALADSPHDGAGLHWIQIATETATASWGVELAKDFAAQSPKGPMPPRRTWGQEWEWSDAEGSILEAKADRRQFEPIYSELAT